MPSQLDDQTSLFAASTYLSYLPACYGNAGTSDDPPFVALYLKIFEKLISGIDDGASLGKAAVPLLDSTIADRSGLREVLDANVIGNLFYPRWSFLFGGDAFADDAKSFMPPLSGEQTPDKKKELFNRLARYFGLPDFDEKSTTLTPVELWARSFLQWLGATIGLKIDKNWSIDASRTMIAKALAFDRARGTPMGIEWLLDACLAACPQPIDGVTLTAKATVSDCTRQALIVRDDPHTSFVLRDSYPDAENAVVISDIVGFNIKRDGINIEVKDDSDPVADVPWRFDVDIKISADKQLTQDRYAAIHIYARVAQAVLDVAKPALTTYVLNVAMDPGGGGAQ